MRDATLIALTFIAAGFILGAFGWLVLQVDADTMRWMALTLFMSVAFAVIAGTSCLTGKRDAVALDKLLQNNRDLTDHVLAFKNPWAVNEVNAMRAARAAAEGPEEPVPYAETEARLRGDGLEEMLG